jgi:hypothetical protein
MKFTVQASEEEFRIIGPDGEEGCAVEFGDVAVLQIGSAIYYAEVEDLASVEDARVMRVQSVQPMPTEVETGYEFEDEDDEDDEIATGPVLVEARIPATATRPKW